MANLYGNKWIGFGYDLLASLVWLPSKNKLYDNAVSLLDIQPNETVLELGCGTGYLTKKLLAKKFIIGDDFCFVRLVCNFIGNHPRKKYSTA